MIFLTKFKKLFLEKNDLKFYPSTRLDGNICCTLKFKIKRDSRNK